MKKYTVKQLADLAKISVRTLHYYDEIGLLRPQDKSDSGYRFYQNIDLMRLQQIMFYKELGLSLMDIQKILDNSHFDIKKALRSHRTEISSRLEHFKKLINTIDKTLKHLNKKTMLTDQDIYAGFTPEEAASHRQEVIEKWGEKSFQDTEKRIRKMSPQKWAAVKTLGEDITKRLADLMDEDPASSPVQKCIAEWHKWLENFYPVTKERLLGLGNLYVEDERFTAHYEKFRKGLAKFKNQAIQIYCDNQRNL